MFKYMDALILESKKEAEKLRIDNKLENIVSVDDLTVYLLIEVASEVSKEYSDSVMYNS
ncbi:MAG TPA: hypothetical protein VNW06_05390 [Cytophagaceae bacterium]|nr:hypothetical protein [Cytophagaceae bacterium]